MKKPFFHPILLVCITFAAALPGPLAAQNTRITDLVLTDEVFLELYRGTVASKNRILKHERKSIYDNPVIYSYMLKQGEDIWTLIARSSLNIDTIATLNRVDFIGMLGEGVTVYLSDTLGLFFEKEGSDIQVLADRYSVPPEEVLIVEDPASPGGELFFLPETRLSFLERTYLTGVVFYAPLIGSESSKFGTRADPFVNREAFHGGIDIAAREKTRVHAARRGSVVFAGESGDYGNLVVIEHELGYHTLYAHLASIGVEAAEAVESGQIIGTVGSTGRSTGPHLHFEIRRFDWKLNPDNIPFFLGTP